MLLMCPILLCHAVVRKTAANIGASSQMNTIRITTDTSKHAGCGGLLAMSSEAPLYIVEHGDLETRIPGVEMVCLKCGERIRSQEQVEE